MVTNGLLLDADTAQRLIDHELGRLVVSIESPTAEIHNRIRGKRTFERMMANIEKFLVLRGSQAAPGLVINTVLCRPNRDTFAQMIPFCYDLGAEEWSALTLNYIGNAVDNLDNLALSQAEHTEVALEIGRMLQAPGFDIGRLKVNMTIVFPLVWEYLCKKYGIHLPQPEICCTASISLVYVSPTGDLHLCDRVNSSGYTGSKLETETMRPMNLLTNTFDDIWNSRQFIEMFNFVKRAETYAGFDPCHRCKYFFDRTCNPCPLQSYRSDHIRFEECLKAEAYLGDISRYDDGPRTPWEESHQFAPVSVPACGSDAYAQMQHRYPVPVRGTRHAEYPDGTALLMHPESQQLIKVNAIGGEIWNAMSGLLTTDEVIASAVQLYLQVSEAFHVTLGQERMSAFTEEMQKFVLALYDQGFIEFRTSPVAKVPEMSQPHTKQYRSLPVLQPAFG
jgi:MoaA/NifB/PqqE/SkfB family radical SAM enzyme